MFGDDNQRLERRIIILNRSSRKSSTSNRCRGTRKTPRRQDRQGRQDVVLSQTIASLSQISFLALLANRDLTETFAFLPAHRASPFGGAVQFFPRPINYLRNHLAPRPAWIPNAVDGLSENAGCTWKKMSMGASVRYRPIPSVARMPAPFPAYTPTP